MFSGYAAAVLVVASALSCGSSWAANAIHPSQPTMRGKSAPTIETSASVVDLTLSDAVFLSLRDNRAIRSALLQRVAQKFDLQVAEDQFTPKLALRSRYISGENQNYRYRYGELSPTATMESALGTQFTLSWINHVESTGTTPVRTQSDGLNFSVIQPLLRSGGIETATASVRLARLNEKVNRLSLKSTVSQTVTQIVLVYRDLLRAQEQVRIAQEALARSRDLLEVNRALIAAGRMAQFDAVQTEADVATQEFAVEEGANNLEVARHELLRLLALDLNTPIRASEQMTAKSLELNAATALQIALEHQPAYLTQLIANEQAAITLGVAKNQKLWDVSLVGSANRTSSRVFVDQGSNMTKQWDNYAGVQISIPLGDMRPRQNELRAEVAVQDSAISVAEARQALERDVSNRVREVQTRWRQYEISKRAKDLSARKVEIEREKLKVGRSSNFQVLSFEADLRTAENNHLNALLAYLNAQTQLDEKLGMTLESWEIALND